jgi:LPS O-antigen subunit length determinant protein (WzzB/FepE family)
MNDITKEQMRDRLGNIDQIRNLLFGEQLGEYSQRFQSYEDRFENIESELLSFQEETRNRLNQLQNSLTTEIRSAVDSIEKKIKYISLTSQEARSDIQQNLQEVNQKLSQDLTILNKSFVQTTTDLKDELSSTRSNLEKDIETLRNKSFDAINNYINELKETKVSRVDLAEVLFELCLKVKGTEYMPESENLDNDSVKAEFLLPEKNTY